ncbi:ZIP family metal transporter [Patescibacteria group bacterium]
MEWLYTLVSVLLISAVSMTGAIVLFLNKERLNKLLIYLVSLAAGTLLGAAFFHLIPETLGDEGVDALVFVLIGILLFFVLEKIIRWRHCHDVTCDGHSHAFSYVMIVGDAVHNFIDGALIAAAFMVDFSLGIATSLAVIVHEIPQEIGDFGALIYAGFSKKKALIFNLISSLTAFVGAIIVLIVGRSFLDTVHYVIPLAAGGFIYIAAVDLLPEMHKENKVKKSIGQLLFILIGIGIMWGMTLFE